ncbi:hypothetical protein [Paludibacterium denitrificans]|uniref:hypothetical protein n=1 Tax=Paludibacterium denitrificans TaxID=2675226 RepID=UPI001E3338D5|nr:hypothetical protein [Paludibacterium denitrificans]
MAACRCCPICLTNGEWVIDGLNGIIAEDVAQLAPSLMRAMTLAEDNEQLARSVAINRELVPAKALHADNMAAFAALYRELLARQGKTGGVAARQEQG